MASFSDASGIGVIGVNPWLRSFAPDIGLAHPVPVFGGDDQRLSMNSKFA
jgi:hypothetical protein